MLIQKSLAPVLAAALLAAGCSAAAPGAAPAPGGAAPAPDNAAAPAKPAGPVTLKMAGIEYPYTQVIIDEFMKKHADIKIEWSAGGVNFEDGSIQALIRSGSAPDLIITNSGPGRVGLLSNAGLIHPLDDVMKKLDIESRYQQWVIEQTRAQGKGKVYELVEGVDVFQVYYNKQMFDRFGLKVPTTWEEFLAVCDRLKKENILPIAAGFRKGIGGGWMLGNLVESSAGKDLTTEVIYGKGTFDQKPIVLGGEMLKQLVDAGYVDGKEAAALDQAQAQALFIGGKSAMNISPQGVLSSPRSKGEDVSAFDAFLLPSRDPNRPARPSAGLAHSWIVPTSTKHMDAVEKWLDFISSEDYLKLTSTNGAVLVPVLQAASKIKYDPAIEDAIKKLSNGAGYNFSVYLPAKAKDAWYAAVDHIVAGAKTPEQAMKDIEAELSKAKAESH